MWVELQLLFLQQEETSSLELLNLGQDQLQKKTVKGYQRSKFHGPASPAKDCINI